MTKTRAHSPIDEANVWAAADLPGREGWAHTLTADMIAEIEAATRKALDSGLALEKIDRAAFPLEKTAPLLAKAYDEVENGRGFAVVAGWPVDDHDYRENVTAYAGIAAYFGDIVVQNYEGDWITDVRDEGIPYSHLSRGYRSNKALPFHTDGAGVVGLLCLGEAASGGRSLLVSATKVFNTFLDEHPEMLETLERGFYHHRRRQHDPGENPVSEHPIPVFSLNRGHWHCCYNRNPIEWVEKEGVTLTQAEREVLDTFDSITARPELQANMEMRKGDMQFVNNFVILHSRTEFQNDATRQRHLVRLWLEDPNSKRLGEGLLDLYVPGTSRYHRKAG